MPHQNSPESLPVTLALRLPYMAPKVICFGDLSALTQSVGASGKTDGGVIFGMMSSGL